VDLEHPFQNDGFTIVEVPNIECGNGTTRKGYWIERRIEMRWYYHELHSLGEEHEFYNFYIVAPNVILFKGIALDFNLFQELDIHKFEPDRLGRNPPTNLQINESIVAAIHDKLNKMKNNLEDHMWESFLLVFPEGTKLTVEHIVDNEEDRRLKRLPFSDIDAVSYYQNDKNETVAKSDDYMQVIVAIDELAFEGRAVVSAAQRQRNRMRR
jgi:hypothetical protein